MTAPSGAAGRTRCPGCDRRFTDDPERATTTIAGTEPTSARPGYRAGRADGRVAVDIRWHVDCLAAFRAQNDAYRRQCLLDSRDMVETIATAAGLDVAEILDQFDRKHGL